MQSIDKIDTRVRSAKLMSKKEIAQDTFEVTFELENMMSYMAGQYVWVELVHAHFPDANGNRRPYSLVSIPDGTKYIAILFRSTDSGFNKSLRQLDIGDELKITGPFGSAFCFPEDIETPLILIAGGVGLAPFLSLIRQSTKLQLQRKITLITINDSLKRVPYVEELEKYNEGHAPVKTVSLTRKIEYQDVAGLENVDRAAIYISGPQGFVNYVYSVLKPNGIFDRQLHFEANYPDPIHDHILAKIFVDGKPQTSPAESAETRQRTELLYGLVNASATHTIVTDVNGVIVFANQGSQNITGYTLSEMLGKTPRLWGGMMSKGFYEKLWKMKLAGKVFTGEIINRRKNGEIYVASTHLSPIKNEAGDIIGYIGSEEDITPVRRAEQVAAENEQRFIQLTEKIPEIYWIIEATPHEKVAYVNPAFEKIWGLPRSALYEDPRIWLKSIHPDDLRKVLDTFELFLQNKSDFNMEFRIIRPDGAESIIHTQSELVLDEHGKAVRAVGVAHDITKEKTIDREKTDFVSFASHQFRTPVTAIRWNIETLLSGKYGEVPTKQKEILERMHTMDLRIDELISNMLNVSRIEQGVFIIEPTPTDFVKICEEVLMEMEPYIAKKGHELIKNYAENLPHVPADSKLLRIIFQNYISNAIKYTPEKGKITVSIKIDGGDILLSVANNGAPVPESDKPRIFEKMFRAGNAMEQDPGGTGLGLYIVKDIVENGGGRAWFTSDKEEGTIFYASFPLSGMLPKEGTKSLQ